jgi:hypothetical protein
MARSSSWWLIVNHESGWMEVLTLSLAGGEKMLPVFSFKEEAELFVTLGASFARGGWRGRRGPGSSSHCSSDRSRASRGWPSIRCPEGSPRWSSTS